MLWESGAIITYIVEQYDAEKKLSYETVKEKNLVNQWLHFQMSGQGPYWGTAGWFVYSPSSLQNHHLIRPQVPCAPPREGPVCHRAIQ